MPISRRGKTRAIYALLDPRDDTVRYVGCAIDVEKRFKEHLRDKGNTPKCQWLAELKRNGLNPELEILEVVDGFIKTFSREDYWIRKMLTAGAPLTNVIPTQGSFAKRKAAVYTPSNQRGTKLRIIRKRLKVTKDDVASLAGIGVLIYTRAESGNPIGYSVAVDILQAINSILEEFGESELTLEELDWIAD